MWKSDVMNIFSYHFPRPGGVKSYHVRGTQISWLDTPFPIFFFECWFFFFKSIPCVAKNASGQRRYSYAVVSSCAIKLFYFQRLAMLINHVRIHGSNVAEGFPAFQRRSCMNLCEMMLRFSVFLNSSFIKSESQKRIYIFTLFCKPIMCDVILYIRPNLYSNFNIMF